MVNNNEKSESGVKLRGEELHFMRDFARLTGAVPRDCVIDGNERIIFVVSAGEAGRVIGKGGANIKHVREVFQREVNVVEYDEKPENFVKNALAPAKIKNVSVVEQKDGKRVSVVDVDPEDRGRAIGKNGRNIGRARILARRHFGIEDIILA